MCPCSLSAEPRHHLPELRLLFALSIALLLVCVTACGGASQSAHGRRSPSAVAESPQPKDSNDGDDDAQGDDDMPVMAYGRPAGHEEERKITELLRHYYAAAAAANGVRVCSLLFSRVAEEAPEEYGQSGGPGALGGKTCVSVISELFKRRHRRQVAESSTFAMTGVRVLGGNGLALLRFAGSPGPFEIEVRRETGKWKIMELIASGLA
jgi:hypothetical protein